MGLDRPNAATILTGVHIGGDVCDLHMRRTRVQDSEVIHFCAVYVWPHFADGQRKETRSDATPIVNGYWFIPSAEEAAELAARFA